MPAAEPFSRIVRVDTLPKEGKTVALEATEAERNALATFLKLPSIEALCASLTLKRSTRGGVRVTGAIHVELTQTCVVSLEPFSGAIDEDIDVRFAPPAPAADPELSRAGDGELEMSESDAPDPLIDGRIDLGALATEFVALGLDPYPRRPGVTFEPPSDGAGSVKPFSALRSAHKKAD